MSDATDFFTGNGFSRLTGPLADKAREFDATLEKARSDAGFSPKGNLREPVITAEFPGCPTDLPINYLALPNRQMDYCLIRIKPGHGFPEHVHGYGDEIYLVISGHGKVRIDGELYDAGPLDTFHQRTGVRHEVFNPAENEEDFEIFAVNTPAVHQDLRSKFWGIPVPGATTDAEGRYHHDESPVR
jgi:mannose-6-phosphate isomerase-like protein (cupin superfamily)